MSDTFEEKADEFIKGVEDVIKRKGAQRIAGLRGRLVRAIAEGMRAADKYLQKIGKQEDKP